MKTPLVIFGAGDIAELADYYFQNDSAYEVAAFTVDAKFMAESTFKGRPLIAFEEVATQFPPASHHLFVALSYTQINRLRREKYEAAKAKEYTIASYVSSRATMLNDGRVGENCFLLEDNTVQPFVTIGDNVTLWSGNHIGHHSQVGEHTFIASHVVVSGGVRIGTECFIGVNATIRDHVSIGDRCVIGAGALVLSDVDAEGVLMAEATQRSRVPSSRLRRI